MTSPPAHANSPRFGPCWFCAKPGRCCATCGVYLCYEHRRSGFSRIVGAVQKASGVRRPASECDE